MTVSILLKTAELGKSIAAVDKDQLATYRDPSTVHTIALGDSAPADGSSAPLTQVGGGKDSR